jgi:Ca2+-binding RTX toxin-like protein
VADPDAGTTLAYTKSGADAALFNVNATTGALTFITSPDFEAPGGPTPDNAYAVTITASDGLLSVSQNVNVSVTNVNGVTINGTTGNDLINGTNEAEAINGNAGNDTINALAGNDTINGGAGADNMTGGAGNEIFAYSATTDSAVATPDTIQDFVSDFMNAASSDLINLSAIDARTQFGQFGNQAFNFVAAQNAGVVANSITWSESGGNTIVRGDVNGNTTADFQIILIGTGKNLVAADFVL